MRYALLDIVRGLAALWVFAFHYPQWDGLRESAPFLRNLMQQGHLGVPLFFVVSGYCLMASTRSAVRREETAAGFLKRRFIRIYPPLWCSMVLVVALPWLMALLSRLKSGAFEAPVLEYADLGLVGWFQHASLLQIFASGYDRIVDKFSAINSVYWTLGIEVQFYLVMGLALCVRRALMPVLLVTTLLGAGSAFFAPLYLSGLFLPYWPMFAMGIALYLVFERGWEPPATRTSRYIGLAILVAGLTAIGLDLLEFNPHGFAALATVALYFMRSVDGWLTAPLRGARALIRGALKLLGQVSYSLYLLHAELMLLVLMFTRQVVPQASLVSVALTFTITLALTYPFYVLCERPFMRHASARPRE